MAVIFELPLSQAQYLSVGAQKRIHGKRLRRCLCGKSRLCRTPSRSKWWGFGARVGAVARSWHCPTLQLGFFTVTRSFNSISVVAAIVEAGCAPTFDAGDRLRPCVPIACRELDNACLPWFKAAICVEMTWNAARLARRRTVACNFWT